MDWLYTEAKLSGYSGPFLWCILEYVHLWMATQGTEESEELRVTIASSAAIANGLWLDQLSCVDSPRLDKQM